MKKAFITVFLLLAAAVLAGPDFAQCFDVDKCLENCPAGNNPCTNDCLNQAEKPVDGPLLTVKNDTLLTYTIRWTNAYAQQYTIAPRDTIKIPQCVTASGQYAMAFMLFDRDGRTNCFIRPTFDLGNPPHEATISIEYTGGDKCYIGR